MCSFFPLNVSVWFFSKLAQLHQISWLNTHVTACDMLDRWDGCCDGKIFFVCLNRDAVVSIKIPETLYNCIILHNYDGYIQKILNINEYNELSHRELKDDFLTFAIKKWIYLLYLHGWVFMYCNSVDHWRGNALRCLNDITERRGEKNRKTWRLQWVLSYVRVDHNCGTQMLQWSNLLGWRWTHQ